ncbi:MAG TPA: transcription repressor NadR [Firmicutes bacterium]|jgi:transcriptional regulator of NAD metabolism|nr:MAG: transcriptional regulator [Peptococcaceae bacterium 1109]HHT73639.1 transcription repressor NadR [Bacillota bacterium]
MRTAKRRAEILKVLKQAKEPVTGTQLSQEFGVTRQVVVADIAILRAQGENIMATPQGYLLYPTKPGPGLRRTIAARHSEDLGEIKDELAVVVELGGAVVDVTVEHPLYGEMTGNLQCRTMADVEQFVGKMQAAKAEPLLVLTDGLHLHTIEAPDEGTMARILAELKRRGYLAE